MLDDTMKSSGEKQQEDGDEDGDADEDAMINESAAESDDDGSQTSSSSSHSEQCDVSKRFHPIRSRLSKNTRSNGWNPTYLTEPKSHWEPPPIQQTQPEANQRPTSATQPERSQLPQTQLEPTQMERSRLWQTQTPELSAQHPKSGDFIEIHCLIERLELEDLDGCGGRERCMVLDAVTPVPVSVPLRNLVETVLNAHHFDSTDVLGAKGSILPNSKWQAIKLDDVADDSSATVGDIVSGIETSRLVLKITLPSFSCEQTLRDKLLQFLLSVVSIDLFTKTNCPLDKTMLDQLRVGDRKLNLTRNKLSAFERWAKEFNCGGQLVNGVQLSTRGTAFPVLVVENRANPRSLSPKTLDLRAASPRSSAITFDPSTEITKLTSWFERNPDPSLTDLLMYADKLNCQPFRCDHRVTLNSVVSWFVEARAKSSLHHPEQFQSSRTSTPNSERKRKRRGSGCESKSKESVVPSLPNSNAVYVVDPHLTDSSDSESPVVVQPTDDGDLRATRTTSSPNCSVDVTSTGIFETRGMKSDENHNWTDSSTVSATTDQATDLSLVKRSHPPHSRKPWNWKPVAMLDPTGRHSDKRPEKDTREHEVSSGSSSPKVATENTLPASFYPSYPLATMSGLPIHPNSFHAATMQILQQRALYNFSHPVFVPQPYDIENMGSPGSGNEENDRRKRSRVFIDPTSEIPRLEQWYLTDTHPSAQTIEQYTDELNKADYRQRFPKLEPKNVQLWFKNHRAKMKRLRMEQVKCEAINAGNGFLGH